MTAGLLLAFLAYLLLYAGVKGVHPWGPIVESFGGKAPPPPGSKSGTPDRPAKSGEGVGIASEPKGGGGIGSSGLTRNAQAAYDAIRATYPGLLYVGGPNCRRIIPHDHAPTGDEPWSEHAWGNAIDFEGPAALMRKLMVWANLPHIKLRYKINNVIPPGSAVPAVHIDFFPSHTGQTPPCAGGQ